MVRDSIVFYRSWLEAIKNLPREMQGEVLTAIIEYGLDGETTESLKPITRAMLAIVKPQIDANNVKYENGKKGAEHGSKGGRPKKENPNETPRKPQENPKVPPNVYDNVNEDDKTSLSLTREEVVFPPPDVFDKSLSECYSELSANQSWAETVTMNTRAAGYLDFTLESFYVYLKQFFMEQQNKGEVSKSPKDAMSHYASWLKIELKKQEDDKRRAKNVKSTATNPAGKVVCSKTKEGTDSSSGGDAQEDYSARF